MARRRRRRTSTRRRRSSSVAATTRPSAFTPRAAPPLGHVAIWQPALPARALRHRDPVVRAIRERIQRNEVRGLKRTLAISPALTAKRGPDVNRRVHRAAQRAIGCIRYQRQRDARRATLFATGRSGGNPGPRKASANPC